MPDGFWNHKDTAEMLRACRAENERMREALRESRAQLEVARRDAGIFKEGFLRLAEKHGEFIIDENGEKSYPLGIYVDDGYSEPMCEDYPREACIGCGECNENAHTVFDGMEISHERYEVISGEAVPGVIEDIKRLKAAGYRVVVMTSRALMYEGKKAAAEWMRARNLTVGYGLEGDEGFDVFDITYRKVPALVYIDDRGVTFRPGMDLVETVRSFKPWMNEKPIESAFE